MHIPFCRHTWAELSLLSWKFLSGTFFPGGGGGGGVHVHPVYCPQRTRLRLTVWYFRGAFTGKPHVVRLLNFSIEIPVSQNVLPIYYKKCFIMVTRSVARSLQEMFHYGHKVCRAFITRNVSLWSQGLSRVDFLTS